FAAPAPPAIYPLSLHDALPISPRALDLRVGGSARRTRNPRCQPRRMSPFSARRPWRTRPNLRGSTRKIGIGDCHNSEVSARSVRSEEHTSELQSRSDLVCRLLL